MTAFLQTRSHLCGCIIYKTISHVHGNLFFFRCMKLIILNHVLKNYPIIVSGILLNWCRSCTGSGSMRDHSTDILINFLTWVSLLVWWREQIVKMFFTVYMKMEPRRSQKPEIQKKNIFYSKLWFELDYSILENKVFSKALWKAKTYFRRFWPFNISKKFRS